MADDEQLAPVEELEPIVAPEEDGGPAVDPEQQPEDPVAKLAMELGWSDKSNFRGPPDDWKPADEFIRASRDITKTLKRDLRELRSTVDHMGRTSATLLEQQLANQRAELESQFHQAVEAGDTAGARKAVAEIDRLETQAPPPPSNITPEGQSFAQKHNWFGKDDEATRYAISRADVYAKQGLTPARQIIAVEKDMREIFPDLFPAPAKPAPSVAQPASRTASTAGRAKGFNDMPAAAQVAARDMADRGVIPNVDAYVVNYFKQTERKVG